MVTPPNELVTEDASSKTYFNNKHSALISSNLTGKVVFNQKQLAPPVGRFS